MGREGFCAAEVKPAGPSQLNVNGAVPAIMVAFKFRVEPAQSGAFDPALTVTAKFEVCPDAPGLKFEAVSDAVFLGKSGKGPEKACAKSSRKKGRTNQRRRCVP